MQQPKKKPTKREKFQQSHEQAKAAPKPASSVQKSIMPFYLLITVLALITYGNTLSNGYVLDDFSVIKENNIVNQGAKNIGMIFKTSYRTGYLNVNDGLYRPLSLVMFAIEWSLSPDNPFLGHLMNILVYICCGLILLKTLLRLLPQLNENVLIAAVLLFMAHPIHTEVAGNIKSRDELLCFLFSFISIYQVLKYVDTGKILSLIAGALSIFIALLAKESAILVIPIMGLMLFYFRREASAKYTGAAAAMLLPFALYMLLRKGILGSFAGLQSVTTIDNPIGTQANFFLKLAGSMQVLGDYFQLFVLPHPLIYDYSYNSIPLESGMNLSILIGILIVFTALMLVFITYKKHPVLSFSLLFIFAGLSLYSNLFITIGAAKAERFTFLASMGFCLGLSYLMALLFKLNVADLSKWSSDEKRKQFSYAIALILVLYSIKTISRNMDWKDNLTLYTHDVDLNPQSAKTHYYLGNELIKKIGEEEKDSIKRKEFLLKGIDEVKKAVSIFPEYSDGWTQIGVGFYKLNLMDSAAVYFQKGLQYNPSNSVALSNLGAYYFNKGRFVEAIDIFKKSIDLNPRFIDAMINLGSCYGASGNYNEAIVWFTKAYELDPTNKKAINFLAVTYMNMKEPEKAAFYQNLLR
ncbi:MAG: tetratricopeptide repeat protein [Bacteroidota bacterium]